MKTQLIYLGADHGGFKLKEQIKAALLAQKINFIDLGSFKLSPADDYPAISFKLAKAVANNKNATGILICGTGFGVCIAANKVKGIRAVTIRNVQEAKSAREHNDANVMCLSGWNLNLVAAKKIIQIWQTTSFLPLKRYRRRVAQINKF